jgi:hypothetical protein
MNDFEQFWQAYPRKVGKGAARRIFGRIKPGAELLAKMLDAVAIQSQSIQWQKDAGQFIPHPATWLNQERWDDEIKVTITKIERVCWCGKPATIRVLNTWGCCYDHATDDKKNM